MPLVTNICRFGSLAVMTIFPSFILNGPVGDQYGLRLALKLSNHEPSACVPAVSSDRSSDSGTKSASASHMFIHESSSCPVVGSSVTGAVSVPPPFPLQAVARGRRRQNRSSTEQILCILCFICYSDSFLRKATPAAPIRSSVTAPPRLTAEAHPFLSSDGLSVCVGS